jgi:hypothetical protein
MNKYTVISSMIQFFGKTNTQPSVYKKTSRDFKRKYGIDFTGAPIVFKKHDIIWKLQYVCTYFNGRKVESAYYVPQVEVKHAFNAILRNEINV